MRYVFGNRRQHERRCMSSAEWWQIAVWWVVAVLDVVLDVITCQKQNCNNCRGNGEKVLLNNFFAAECGGSVFILRVFLVYCWNLEPIYDISFLLLNLVNDFKMYYKYYGKFLPSTFQLVWFHKCSRASVRTA